LGFEAEACLGVQAARAAAEALVAAAMANGSQDNVTVLVVWFAWEV
jgi:serine/threonine protein phosphatase PrpC